MLDSNIEIIDGYRILHLTDESSSEIERNLQDGTVDGISVNPYRGWRGNFADLLAIPRQLKALVVPFGDRIGFEANYIDDHPEIEMLLISEFSGALVLKTNKLEVLRAMVSPQFELGPCRSLKVLALLEPMKNTLIDICPNVRALESVEINAGKLSSLQGIENCTAIQRVNLVNGRTIKSVQQLTLLPKLEDLLIESTRKLTDLVETLSRLTALKRLRLIDCGELKSFEFLDHLALQEFRCSRTKVANRSSKALQRIPTVFVG